MDWPFLARTTEVEALSRIATDPTAGGALVVGPPGVGKTTLLRRVAADLDDSGVPTRWVVGSASDQRIDFSSLGGLLSSAPNAPSLRTTDVYRAAFAELAAAPVGNRVCVFVDNGHLIDEASASLIHKLADSGTITALISARSLGDTGRAVHALWASGQIRQIHLTPLPDEDMAGILTAVLGPTVHPLTRATILDASDGIPLVEREIVAGTLDAGYLEERRGWWRLRPGWETLGRVAEGAAYAFGAIDQPLREPLESLAVAGPLELSAFEQLTVDGGVEELEQARFVRVLMERSRAVVRFEHPMVATALLGALPMARRRRLAGVAAEVISDLGGRRQTDHFRIASLWLEAGRPTDSRTALLGAKWALGALRAQDAQRLAPGGAADGQDVFEGRLTLAQALALVGDTQGAEESLHAAQKLATKRKQRARCSVVAMRNLSIGSGRWNDAVEVGRRAARELEGSRSGSDVQAEVDRYLVRMGGGELRRRKRSGVRAEGRGLASSAPSTATSLLGTIEWRIQRGRFDHAIRLADEMAAQLPSGLVASPLARHEAARYGVLARALRGDLTEARHLAEAQLDSAMTEQSLPLIGAWSAWLGEVLLIEGRVGEAVDRFGDALVVFEERDPFAASASTTAQRAVALVHLGRIDEALTDIEATMNAGLELVADREAYGRAQRWFDAATGHLQRAAEHAAEAATSFATTGHLALAVLAGHDAVRFGRADLVASVMASSGHVDGGLLSAMASQAAAAHGGDPGRLSAIGDSYEHFGAVLLAAETFTQSARTYADLDDRVGERKSAERASQLRSELPDIQTPALTRDAGVLTRREAEIARLAAGGETSKRIAERLAISSRTVDNHLASVYTKLGIRGREQLGSVLGV